MPTFGICTSPEHAGKLRGAGFDYVEGGCQDYFKPDLDDAAFEAAGGLAGYVAGAALPVPACNRLLPPDLKLCGEAADLGRARMYMRRLLRRAGQAKVETVVFGAGRSRRAPEGMDRRAARKQVLTFLGDAAPVAEAANVTIAIEPLNSAECNLINTVDEAMTYVRAVDSPRVKCLVDAYHLWRQDEPVEHIAAAGEIAHVHAANRNDRAAPTPGNERIATMYRAFFGPLKRVGYDGRISVEGEVDFEPDALRQTREFLGKQWDLA